MRWAAVQRGEVDALRAARENSQYPLHPGKLAVWDRHAFADCSCADSLPFRENLKNFFFIKRRITGGQLAGHLLKDRTFVAAGEVWNDCFPRQKIRDLHAYVLRRLSLVLPFCFWTWRSSLSITMSMAE